MIDEKKFQAMFFAILLALPLSIGVAACVMLGLGGNSHLGKAVWSYVYFLGITAIATAFLGSLFYGLFEWLKSEQNKGG